MKTLTHQKILTPIILAGGTGTRLWPLSKVNSPKQFQKINGEQSLLQDTLSRVDNFACSKTLIICNNQHRFVVAEQLSKKSDDAQLIIEPEGRNTLAAITVGCLAAIEHQDNPLILVLPSDHLIEDIDNFTTSMRNAIENIGQNQIITFGIKPTRPETGFGYLKTNAGNDISEKKRSSVSVRSLISFKEKPNPESAQRFINSENMFWNSGIFLANASTIIDLVETYQKEILTCCIQAYKSSTADLDFTRLEPTAYSNCPSISFDYGVMELLCADKNKEVDPLVISLDCGWDDLGSWDAVDRVQNKDANQNSILSDAIVKDSENCLVKSDSKLVTLIGMKNTIVIDTKNALLVANIDKAQEVKELVCELERLGKHKALVSNLFYRPWGYYEILVSAGNHQVKRVVVHPGKKISLQRHFQRAEHWVVVSGVASVTSGDKSFTVTKNESTYIPVEKLHRLENNEEELLELIEVQTGDYFGEDDIERFDDEYGRV
jgi:mannose-1-phosphate guanylyltransferase